MCRDGQWKRFAPTSITGAWDGVPPHWRHPLPQASREPYPGERAGGPCPRPVIVPGYNPLGRKSALEVHGMTHTY